MPTPMIHSKKPTAGTNGDGLGFVLQTATPPQEKGKVDVYISALDIFFKPSS